MVQEWLIPLFLKLSISGSATVGEELQPYGFTSSVIILLRKFLNLKDDAMTQTRCG